MALTAFIGELDMTPARSLIVLSLLVGTLACAAPKDSGYDFVQSIMLQNIGHPVKGQLAFDIAVVHEEYASKTVTLKVSSPGSGVGSIDVVLNAAGKWNGSMRGKCEGMGALRVRLVYDGMTRHWSAKYPVACD